MAAVPEDRDQRDRGQEVDERQEAGAQARGRKCAVEHRVGFGVEAALLHPLRAEPLHDPHARDALLDHSREVAELLLELERDGRDATGEARRGDVEERKRAQGEQRERDALQHHHDDDADEDERARRGERDEHHDLVDLLDVADRAGHQLSGLGLVVEGEVQPLEVREQALPEVGLRPVRDPEGGVAA